MKSPCIQVCFLNPDTGLCLGCNRSIEEIEYWTRYNDKKRDEIMAQLPSRKNEFIKK